MSNRDLPRIRRYHGSTGIERPRVCAGTAYIDNCILDCAPDCFGPALDPIMFKKMFPLERAVYIWHRLLDSSYCGGWSDHRAVVEYLERALGQEGRFMQMAGKRSQIWKRFYES